MVQNKRNEHDYTLATSTSYTYNCSQVICEHEKLCDRVREGTPSTFIN